MKFIRSMFFFLFAVLCCTSYAHENKYVFVGQNGTDGKTAFILELIGDDLENHVQINENGEVYLKVDKIVSIPKELLSHFAHQGHIPTQHAEAFQDAIGYTPVDNWRCGCGWENNPTTNRFQCEVCRRPR